MCDANSCDACVALRQTMSDLGKVKVCVCMWVRVVGMGLGEGERWACTAGTGCTLYSQHSDGMEREHSGRDRGDGGCGGGMRSRKRDL